MKSDEGGRSVPLYRQIQEDIRANIASGVLREGNRVASESEMQNYYHVSSITVKNALNGLVDDGLIYRVKGKGTFVSSNPFEKNKGETKYSIGVVLCTMMTRVDQLFFVYICHYCQKHKIEMKVELSNDLPDMEIMALRKLIHDGLDGLLLFPVVAPQCGATLRQLLAKKVPFVCVDRHIHDLTLPLVTSDNRSGARMVMERMIARYGGDIAIVLFYPTNTASMERKQGFEEELVERGYAFGDANQCLISNEDGKLSLSHFERVKCGYHCIRRHLRKYPHIRAMLAVEVAVAQTAFYSLWSMGLEPGLRFGLSCFDDPHLPGVSYISQNISRIVDRSFEQLFEQIRGKFEPREELIPVSYVEVASAPAVPEDIYPLVQRVYMPIDSTRYDDHNLLVD